MAELRQRYSLEDIILAAQMPRSVYYYWESSDSKVDPYLDTKAQIKTIFHAHKGRYGYRRVHLALCHRQHHRNPKTVQKLMG